MDALPPPFPSDLTCVAFERCGAVATLTFNRPNQLNALSAALIDEALKVSEHVAADPGARILIVRGAGRAFSAGVDLKSGAGYGPAEIKQFLDQARALAHRWETMRQVVIAQVSGYCFTGGLELALGCDLIVCADDAVFSDTHAKVGLTPLWGMSQRLPRRVGLQRAREMSFTARRVDAAEAVRIGLALESVPPGELEARVSSLADAILANSGDSLAAYKDLYYRFQNMGLDEGVAWEAGADYPIGDGGARTKAMVSELGAKAG